MAAKNLKEAVKEDLKENEEKIVRLSEDDVEEFVDEKESIFKKSLRQFKKHCNGLVFTVENTLGKDFRRR